MREKGKSDLLKKVTEMCEKSMGSKEGASGDEVQVSCVCESVLLYSI